MAKYTSADVIIEFDNSSGSLQNMSQYITGFSGLSITDELEESHAFSDSWVERITKGTKRLGEITLSGLYDDTASTGPESIFNDLGNYGTTSLNPRTLKITWGSTKTSSVETYIKSYKKSPQAGEITKFEIVLVPFGTVTEV